MNKKHTLLAGMVAFCSALSSCSTQTMCWEINAEHEKRVAAEEARYQKEMSDWRQEHAGLTSVYADSPWRARERKERLEREARVTEVERKVNADLYRSMLEWKVYRSMLDYKNHF